MAQEELSKLQSELESLRQENRRLKAMAHLRTDAYVATLPTDGAVADSLLPRFSEQLTRLKEANQRLQTATEGYTELTRSLDTLVPALEVQLRGLHSELHQLRGNQQDTEATYASVVADLEKRIQTLKAKADQASPAPAWKAQLEQAQAENDRLAQRVAELARQCEQYEAQLAQETQADPVEGKAERDHPFTSLNIFDV